MFRALLVEALANALITASIVFWIASLIAVVEAVIYLARGAPNRRHLVALILVSASWVGMGLMLAIGLFRDIDPPARWIALVPAGATVVGLMLNAGPAPRWPKRWTWAIAACAAVLFLLIPGGGPVFGPYGFSMWPPYPWSASSSENPRVCVKIERPGGDVGMYVVRGKSEDDDVPHGCELFRREVNWSVLERAPHTMAGQRGVRYVLCNPTPSIGPFWALSGERKDPYYYCWVVRVGEYTYDFIAYGPDRDAVVAQAERIFSTVRFSTKD